MVLLPVPPVASCPFALPPQQRTAPFTIAQVWNPPAEIAKMRDPYFGLDKLEFASDEPSLREYFAPFARAEKTS